MPATHPAITATHQAVPIPNLSAPAIEPTYPQVPHTKAATTNAASAGRLEVKIDLGLIGPPRKPLGRRRLGNHPPQQRISNRYRGRSRGGTTGRSDGRDGGREGGHGPERDSEHSDRGQRGNIPWNCGEGWPSSGRQIIDPCQDSGLSLRKYWYLLKTSFDNNTDHECRMTKMSTNFDAKQPCG
ncbi:hypothetical protein RvY_08552-2 [Ramazzottius varieornatus]|uniref:Uncharacterized protein n=1 Tax=Ramazzottius varieornatus TaxID=947166 RepID=A0A1D1V679_RAMVA|nr:hypothetical protein RvY_08552-2 [Ramazzottius varieornatus]